MSSFANQPLQDCISLCWQCRNECQKTLFGHCLVKGGEHTELDHVKLMADCIEICQTAADFMVRRSDWHASVCNACADVCEACAKSCERFQDDTMQDCADLCHRCADMCRRMSNERRQAA